VVQHSNLFYWWPIWAVGFLFALISLYDNTRLLHVPAHTEVKEVGNHFELSNHDDPKKLEETVHSWVNEGLHPRVAKYGWLGTFFFIILVLVIVITNVPLRGLWSFIVIILVILGAVLVTLFHGWHYIATALIDLRIFIGFAGYLTLSTVLLVVWLFNVLIFDRQIYIIFTPGQMKVCEEIGAGEKVYDTTGMNLEKHRDDLFRHWVLGLGSGDMTVRAQGGGQVHEIRMSNVLFVHRKLAAIEDMQKEKAIVSGE